MPAFPYETLWNSHYYAYLSCRNCGTGFVDPLPSETELLEIYRWASYHSAYHSDTAPPRHQRSLRTLSRILPPGGAVLDFGCGAGDFLRALRTAGYRCAGVEYEPSTIREVASRVGVSVRTLEETLRSDDRFDVIHMSDVLPHLREPATSLRVLERLLRPAGIFLIDGPLENNASVVSWTASFVKKIRRMLRVDSPRHAPPTMLYRFTAASQRKFFERLGYREMFFDVYETGWPYRATDGTGTKGLAKSVKGVIGWLAVGAAKVLPLGNRYTAVYRPETSRGA
jgi:SAM-dependent methyltransferase